MTVSFDMAQSPALGLIRSHPKHLTGSGSMNWPIPTGTVPAGTLGRTSGTYSGLQTLITDSESAGSAIATGLNAGQEQATAAGFGDLLVQALGRTNEMQLDTMRLSQQMITDPDSVNIHDVTIAMAEANLSLSMTKAIADRAIKAYREIISTR